MAIIFSLRNVYWVVFKFTFTIDRTVEINKKTNDVSS